MATWYVRPSTAHSGTRNGTSYATAWGGWAEIVWGASGVAGGDTLYVCGAHTAGAEVIVGAHGASSNAARATISGGYAPDPGSITIAGSFFNVARAYTNVADLTLARTTTTGTILYVPVNDAAISGMDISGTGTGILIDGASNRTNILITGNTVHDCVGVLGSSGRGIAFLPSTASRTHSNIRVIGNVITRCTDFGLRFSIESAAWDSTVFNGIVFRDNRVSYCGGTGAQIRSGNGDLVTWPLVMSSNVFVERNTIHNCGTVAGASGQHGGIAVSGVTAPVIRYNTVFDTYVTGAGIQTAKNVNPVIDDNVIYGIRSGTPTSGFNNGLPIDGNGIFFDNLTRGGIARRNVICDLVSTGNPNSGTGLSFWNTTEPTTFESNLVYDCYRGASYGNATETGNKFVGNTFVNCDIGVYKVGTSALTGNCVIKNNLFVNCPSAFTGETNPGATWDYNAYTGTLTGISAGANDITADPQLADNYAPKATSPLISAGQHLGYMRDINGRQRPNPPSIGAHDGAPLREA